MNLRVVPHARNLSFGVTVQAFLVGLVMLLGGCAEPGVKLRRPRCLPPRSTGCLNTPTRKFRPRAIIWPHE
ncbi:MAG: hypothetical protein QF863_02955 [Pseudomonadales bacterium]|nr:hypothetical protein [Pseudomonadales bacterium]